MSLSKTLLKYAAPMFKLSEQSIAKLIQAFPKIKQDVIERIQNCIDREMYYLNRHPGEKHEHLGLTGLCGQISGQVLEILKDHYPVEIKSGWYKLDKHPRFKDKAASLHYWLEVDDKIVDFTASQFRPFVDEPIDDVVITNKSDPRYMNRNKAMKEGYQDVMLDDDYILNWYIEHL